MNTTRAWGAQKEVMQPGWWVQMSQARQAYYWVMFSHYLSPLQPCLSVGIQGPRYSSVLLSRPLQSVPRRL